MAKKLTDEDRAALLKQTLDTAVALVDDLSHAREIVSQPKPSSGDIRRLSAQLRRLLVDRILSVVASPRLGKLTLLAPDVQPVIVSNRANPIPFFMLGGAEVFGFSYTAGIAERAGAARAIPNFDPERRIALNLDSFMRQPVLCFEGSWITRNQALKYIANVAHGVHSGSAADDTEKLIRRMRHIASAGVLNGLPTLKMDVGAFSIIELPAAISGDTIDGVLLEVLATAQHLVKSPDILAIEALVKAEIAQP
jgi:hypothetical protein